MLATGLALAAVPVAARAAPLAPAPGDMVLGSAKAPGQLVVYASPSCPHCAHWWTTDLPVLRQQLIDPGKARLVFREYLTPPNEFAAAAFLLARRAGPARYFEALGAIVARQTEIFESGELWEGLLVVGKSLGLTEPQFTAALSDPAGLEAVNVRFRQGLAQGVEVTPTFYANGTPFEGEASVAQLTRILAAPATKR